MPRKLSEKVRRRIAADPATLSWAHAMRLAIAVGIAYCLAAQLSIALLAKSDGLAMFWIAGGVSAGVLIVFGRNARLPVAAGTMVATVIANLMNDRDILVSTAFTLCNVGEALLAAWLIERYFGSPFTLDRLRNVLGLLAAAIGATTAWGSPRRLLTGCSATQPRRFGPLGNTGLRPAPSASSLLRRW